MITIKFRGKTIRGNEWVYSSTISQGTIKRKANKWFMEISENVWKGLQEGSLGQFTGLYDKDGREIYEGDILVRKDGGALLTVEFRHGAFGYEYCGEFHAWAGNHNFTFNPYDKDVDFSIIGNIHDNPELLKGGNQ
jgi:uncharacterized phage protein (TIGR01671 family)